MLLNLVLFATLILFAILVSQPLFYFLALTSASRALGAAAYIEIRHSIDAEMQKRGAVLYYSTLAACILLFGIAIWHGNTVVSIAAAVTLLGLIADIVLMMKGNVPINGIINTWTPERYPADWEQYRAKWLQIFGYRQVALGLAFVSLLLGAVFK